MSHILLLGAGFSRNWGGLLANEVFEHLICQEEVAADEYLRNLLWSHRTTGGFENALAEVQAAFRTDPGKYAPSFHHLQAAVSTVFNQMNQGFFDATEFEFQQNIDRMLRTFLVRFDAIFTLNQDVLLEHHYFRHIELATPRRWNGPQLPGLRRIPSIEVTIDSSWGKDTWVPNESFEIEKGLQPCFKLHGSSNWKDSEGGSLLVTGGDKSREIQSHSVLTWYFDQFKKRLSAGGSRLFIIGYGFRDSHVNDVIIDAVNRYSLQFFVIDPLGSDVVRRANPSDGGAIYSRNDLDDAFRQGLIGASRRSLIETFGKDQISHANVMAFFR